MLIEPCIENWAKHNFDNSEYPVLCEYSKNFQLPRDFCDPELQLGAYLIDVDRDDDEADLAKG